MNDAIRAAAGRKPRTEAEDPDTTTGEQKPTTMSDAIRKASSGRRKVVQTGGKS